jgi:hypothetical protein
MGTFAELLKESTTLGDVKDLFGLGPSTSVPPELCTFLLCRCACRYISAAPASSRSIPSTLSIPPSLTPPRVCRLPFRTVGTAQLKRPRSRRVWTKAFATCLQNMVGPLPCSEKPSPAHHALCTALPTLTPYRCPLPPPLLPQQHNPCLQMTLPPRRPLECRHRRHLHRATTPPPTTSRQRA